WLPARPRRTPSGLWKKLQLPRLETSPPEMFPRLPPPKAHRPRTNSALNGAQLDLSRASATSAPGRAQPSDGVLDMRSHRPVGGIIVAGSDRLDHTPMLVIA